MDKQVIREVRLSFPRGSGISVTAVSRTPSTEEPPTEVGGHTGPEEGTPVIAHNDNVGGELTDGSRPASEAPESTGQIDTEAAWSNISTDAATDVMDIEVESEATATRGRPPQLQQPISNHGQQRWARVRARLRHWRLACNPNCGRVCANRRHQ